MWLSFTTCVRAAQIAGRCRCLHPVRGQRSRGGHSPRRLADRRRTRALRDLAARTGKAHSSEEVFELTAQTLAEYALDVPFALFYKLDDVGEPPRLTAHIG